jgi:type 1 fimbria pilin
MALARAVNLYGKRPWDWTGESFPAQGTGFQVIIAAVVGQRHVFNHGSYILINTNAAGATGIGMTVRDRDNNNIILWQSDGGIESVTGSIDRDEMSDMAVSGSIGGSLAFQAEANVANTTCSGSCGGYDST